MLLQRITLVAEKVVEVWTVVSWKLNWLFRDVSFRFEFGCEDGESVKNSRKVTLVACVALYWTIDKFFFKESIEM